MGWYRFKVSGYSMFPLIKPGQIICVGTDEHEDFDVGDIIVFKKETFRCHRIVKKFRKNGKLVFVTKGDNNPEIDQYFVTLNEIIGKAEVINPSDDRE